MVFLGVDVEVARWNEAEAVEVEAEEVEEEAGEEEVVVGVFKARAPCAARARPIFQKARGDRCGQERERIV